jgi:hypothetical protein
MIKVAIEIRDRTTRFRVGVHTPNIEQAMSLVQAWYPSSVAKVSFPIDPEGFFVEDTAA